MQCAYVGRNTGSQHDSQFTTRCDIKQKALFIYEPGHRPAQERLRGIHDLLMTKRGNRLLTTSPQMSFVVHEHRCAVLLQQSPRSSIRQRSAFHRNRLRCYPTAAADRDVSHLLRRVDAKQSERSFQHTSCEVGERKAA